MGFNPTDPLDNVNTLNDLAAKSRFWSRYRDVMIVLCALALLVALLGALGVFGPTGCTAPTYEVNGVCVTPHTAPSR